MKKINVKATIFLSAIVLVVVVLLLNLIEFRKTVDFTVPGIQMPKENAYGKQEEVQVSVNGTYYYRVLPWIHGSSFHGQISFAGEGEEPQNYFFTYGASRGFLKEGRGAGWIGTPDAQTTVAIYEAVQNVGKGMISVEDPASYVLYPATTPEEAIAIANVLYPGMLENEAKTASCAAFLPEECPQKIGCSFCTEDYDYVEDAAAVEQLWQEFIQLSGKVTSDPFASSSKRSLLSSFKKAFSILNFRSSSSSSFTYSALVSTEGSSDGTIFGFLHDLSNIFFRPFLCGLNASGPAARKRLTQLVIIQGLVIPSCNAKS